MSITRSILPRGPHLHVGSRGLVKVGVVRGLRRLLQALMSGLVHGIEQREVLLLLLLLLLKLTVLLLLLLNVMMTDSPSLLHMRTKHRHCPAKFAHVDLE